MSKGIVALTPAEASGKLSSSERRSVLLGAGLIILAALVVYHNSFSVPFLLDDVPSITRNPSIRHLWPVWPVFLPPATAFVGGRPVVNLSFALNYAWGRTSVWGYHAFNLAVHILAGLTLFGVVRRTLLRPALRERFDASATQLALAVAVLWTVHPLQTEAVTYISERCESLMGLFYLLTIYCFIRGVDSQRSSWWFALSVVACLLGMASKEVMVTAPVMVLLYDRTFVSGSFREAWSRHRRFYFALASTWLLLGYLMIGLHYRGVGYGLGISWWDYALVECRGLVRYLRLALWPSSLVFDYGDFTTLQKIAGVLPCAIVLIALLLLTLAELRRRPAVGLLGAWFFIILAPTSSFVPIGGQPIAEHRLYLPLAAVVILFVFGLHALLGRRAQLVFLALAGLLGFLTVQRNEVYFTEMSLMKDTLAKWPSSARAQSNYGRDLLEAGRYDEALAEVSRAVEMDPRNPEAHYNLAFLLQQSGQDRQAIAEYEHALKLNPAHPDAHYGLALVLEKMGREPEAVAHYQQAIEVYPEYAEARVNLGNALLRQGKIPQATGQYEQALRINPHLAEAHANLGAILQREGNLSEAIGQYEQAIHIKPEYVEAHFNLGLALEKSGRATEAIEQYQQALKLRPDFIPAQKGLARLQTSP